MRKTEKLPTTNLSVRPTNPILYALGMLGLTIPGQMYTAYATFFYNDKMNLPLVMISAGMVFFTIWDAFNDPLVGFFSDRTRTRIEIGRAHV